MQSTAKTVAAYLAELPEERRTVIAFLRNKILSVLPAGYEEAMNWGMITYQVPLTVYLDTYNKQPLPLVALASQKHHIAIYLTTAHGADDVESWLREQFEQAGKKLDMGKSCIRFKRVDDIALEPILEIIHKTDMESLITHARQSRSVKK